MPKIQIKTPKGTRDWRGADITLRNTVFDKIRDIFRLHGGAEIDTPVFELKSILTDKYGEDARLIYDLDDQGGELCALRYDLTVPFARWLAMTSTRQMKRFQIGKVYRRDQPAIAQGRMREFFQCDFDYAGEFDLMVPDAEVLCIVSEVFEALDLPVTIRINHRLILDGIFTAVGVPKNLVRAISSAVDKLDKSPWTEVRKEVEEKGLDSRIVAKLGECLQTFSASDGMSATLANLKSDVLLSTNASIQTGVQEMELLLNYLTAYDVAKNVTLDISLARGLDYYTGLIYEVIVNDPAIGVSVGSIAAGGRYDNLVGMFSNRSIPCVGISFGIDRILTVFTAKQKQQAAETATQSSPTIDVWIVVTSNNSILVEQRMALARELRQAGISVDFDAKADRKPQKQVDVAGKHALVAVVIDSEGEDVVFQILRLPARKLDGAIIVQRASLVSEIRQYIA